MLRHEEEVVPVPLGDGVVQDRAGRRVLAVLALLEEDASVDPLLDHHEAQAGRVVVADVLEAVLELQHLVLRSHVELTVSHTIAEDDDCIGPTERKKVSIVGIISRKKQDVSTCGLSRSTF